MLFRSVSQSRYSERRIIAGKVVPFGEIGNTSSGPVLFQKRSIKVGDPGKIKMLMQHKADKPIGRMQKFNEAEDGIYAQFKISSSMQGQDALILASEQLVDGLSVGVEVLASKNKKNYIEVTSAVLKEVSLVETPAFANANVHKVAASENEAENTNQSTESEAPVEDQVTAPQEAKVEAATPTVEAARPTISSVVYTTPRSPINSKASFLN